METRPRLTIDPAAPQDAADLARLMRGLNEHEGDPVEHATEAAMLRDVCAEGRAVDGLVARLDGTAAGFLLFHPAYEAPYAERGSFVTDLYVAPEARRRGVGRALLAAVARATAARGGRFLWLTALARNPGARAFYRSVCDVEDGGIVVFALTRGRFAALAGEG
jgi:ribosomal protein S18 acetylase RimI-like enzyme